MDYPVDSVYHKVPYKRETEKDLLIGVGVRERFASALRKKEGPQAKEYR